MIKINLKMLFCLTFSLFPVAYVLLIRHCTEIWYFPYIFYLYLSLFFAAGVVLKSISFSLLNRAEEKHKNTTNFKRLYAAHKAPPALRAFYIVLPYVVLLILSFCLEGLIIPFNSMIGIAGKQATHSLFPFLFAVASFAYGAVSATLTGISYVKHTSNTNMLIYVNIPVFVFIIIFLGSLNDVNKTLAYYRTFIFSMILFLIIYFMQRTIRRQSEVFNCYYTGEFNTYLNSVNFEAVYARVSAISGYLGLAVLIAYPTYFFVYLPSKYIAILNGTGIIFAESPFFPDIATIVFSSIAVIMGIVLKIPQVKAFMKNIYLCKFKSDYSTDKSPYRSFIS